ncbi:MAG: hypothetical protein KJ064_18300 [Anaerolineae bacterium]|nr:hypothetical protein [Anaerolineae bacterium]
MDFTVFIAVIVAVTLICVVFVVLFMSALANQSIKDTLREIWHTYFGRGDF